MELMKKNAKEYFSKREYLKAVDELYKLGINGFVAFAKRINKEEKKYSWFKTPEFPSLYCKDRISFLRYFS